MLTLTLTLTVTLTLTLALALTLTGWQCDDPRAHPLAAEGACGLGSGLGLGLWLGWPRKEHVGLMPAYTHTHCLHTYTYLRRVRTTRTRAHNACTRCLYTMLGPERTPALIR